MLTPEVTHPLTTSSTRLVTWDLTNPKITGAFTTVRISILGYREDSGPELVELWTSPSSRSNRVLHSAGQYTIPGILSPSPTDSYIVGFVKVYEENPVPVDSSQ